MFSSSVSVWYLVKSGQKVGHHDSERHELSEHDLFLVRDVLARAGGAALVGSNDTPVFF